MTIKDRIAHDLRDAITDGDLAPGDTLPTIRALMDRYDCAWDTVRSGVGVLVHEGLVIPRRGIGTIVRDTTRVDMAYHPDAAAQTWKDQQGADAIDQVITAVMEPADPETASRLGIITGTPVLHRLRHRSLSGITVQTHRQWIVGAIVEDIRTHTGVDLLAEREPVTDLFVLMTQAGHPLRETVEYVSSRMPDEDERDLMDIPLGVPATVIDRVTPTITGEPAEVSQIVGAGDRMVYSYTMPLAKRLGLEDESPA